MGRRFCYSSVVPCSVGVEVYTLSRLWACYSSRGIQSVSGKYLNAIFSCIESNPEKHWSCDNMLCDWLKKNAYHSFNQSNVISAFPRFGKWRESAGKAQSKGLLPVLFLLLFSSIWNFLLFLLEWGAPNPKRGKMWENRSWLILVFASDWSKERCEFSRPIREKTDVKPMQCVITFGVFKVCSCLTLSSDLLYNVCVCIYT